MMKASHQIVLCVATFGIGVVLGTGRIIPAAVQPHVPHSEAGSQPPSAAASVDDVVQASLGALLGEGGFRAMAQIGRCLEELDDDKLGVLLTKLELLPEKAASLLPRLVAGWTRRNPEAATAWLQPRLERWARNPWWLGDGDYTQGHIVGAWTENAPELAVRFARQHPDTALATGILPRAIHRWPDRDYRRQLEVLRSFPAGAARQKTLPMFCATWALEDRAAALGAAEALPEQERNAAVAGVVYQWAKTEPLAALAKAQSLGADQPELAV
jgi:hypothetical protein